MTKKDYVRISEAFYRRVSPVPNGSAEKAVLFRLAMDLCTVFLAENPRFSGRLFLQACGFVLGEWPDLVAAIK